VEPAPADEIVPTVDEVSQEAVDPIEVCVQKPDAEYDLNAQPTGEIGQDPTVGSLQTQAEAEEPKRLPQASEPAEGTVVEVELSEEHSGGDADGTADSQARDAIPEKRGGASKMGSPTSTDFNTAEGASVEVEGLRDNSYGSVAVGVGTPQAVEVETGCQWPSAEVISFKDRAGAADAGSADQSAPKSGGDSEREHGSEVSDVDAAKKPGVGGFLEQAINEVLRRKA
jgi:hypothetical protein